MVLIFGSINYASAFSEDEEECDEQCQEYLDALEEEAEEDEHYMLIVGERIDNDDWQQEDWRDYYEEAMNSEYDPDDYSSQNNSGSSGGETEAECEARLAQTVDQCQSTVNETHTLGAIVMCGSLRSLGYLGGAVCAGGAYYSEGWMQDRCELAGIASARNQCN